MNTISNIAKEYGRLAEANKVFFAKERESDTCFFIEKATNYAAVAVNPMTGERKVKAIYSDSLIHLPHARFYIAEDFDGMNMEDISFESMMGNTPREILSGKFLGRAFFSYDIDGIYVFVGYNEHGFRFAHIETGEVFTIHDIDSMFFYDAKIAIEPGEYEGIDMITVQDYVRNSRAHELSGGQVLAHKDGNGECSFVLPGCWESTITSDNRVNVIKTDTFEVVTMVMSELVVVDNTHAVISIPEQ